MEWFGRKGGKVYRWQHQHAAFGMKMRDCLLTTCTNKLAGPAEKRCHLFLLSLPRSCRGKTRQSDEM
jgi:hypothetical protein